uniref:Protein TAPT1 homolog n=1 Tax=Syphacia muris TaxID=451379 RepID=A0A0N5ASC9_9BILA
MTVRFRKYTKFEEDSPTIAGSSDYCCSKIDPPNNFGPSGETVVTDASPLDSDFELEVKSTATLHTAGDINHTDVNSEDNIDINCKRLHYSLWKYFWNELTRGYSLQNDVSRYTEKRRKVYAFIHIPMELEKFLLYGFMQCIDAFCYLSTFLPLRLFMSFFGWVLRLHNWTSSDTCDFLKGVIILVASLLMRYIDTSVMYHQVRGQGVVKLYIFYNMLEVADKLFSSFGQDIFDALFWTATEHNSSALRTIGHLFAAIVYAAFHTVLVLLQTTTLNVAFNSHNQALIAIMMSNNFVELKGSVFKKFGKPNLFQMSCSDVRERFHIVVILSMVVIRNMMAVNWKLEHLLEMAPDLAMIIIVEFLVDWLKHAFITKFNGIPSEVYKDFTITIAYDVVRSHDESAFSDYSDQVSRRMGFIPIPLTIMVIRVLTQSFDFTTKEALMLLVLAWFLALSVKVLNGVVLLGKACEYVTQYRELQARAEYEIYRNRLLVKKSKSEPNSPRISLVDFADVWQQSATNSVSKGFTVSDLLSHWDELCRTAEMARNSDPIPPPRRTKSFGIISRSHRDSSLPLATTTEEVEEADEISEVSERESKTLLKRRIHSTECESLSDVQAYTLLNTATESSGRIEA